jgi:hypothetical protein
MILLKLLQESGEEDEGDQWRDEFKCDTFDTF